MVTKYSIGDTVLVKAKVERIEIDEEITCFLSGSWDGFIDVKEEDIFPVPQKKNAARSSKKTPEASEKPKKAEKNEENRQKTGKKASSRQQENSGGVKVSGRQQDAIKETEVADRQQDTAGEAKASKRQQEKNDRYITVHDDEERPRISLSPLGKSLAKELANLAK